MDKELKDRLLKAMKDRDIKIPGLSLATGIPQDRIYKWFSQDTNPKAQDTEKLNDWINGKYIQEQGSYAMETKALPADKNQFIDLLKRQVELMQKNNEVLLRILDEKITAQEISLNEIRANQNYLIALVKEGVKRSAAFRYASDPKKLKQELEEINNIAAAALNKNL